MTVVGVDVGGTKIAAGLMEDDGTLITMRATQTPTGPELAAEISCLVHELDRVTASSAVGVGLPGVLSQDGSVLTSAPNIADGTGLPVKAALMGLLDRPVVLDNDANAAAWGETMLGAGQGFSDVVCITVGTGLGGAVVTNGAVLRGGFGAAGEIGHLPLKPDGRRCGCGLRGCLETYVSGTALAHEVRLLSRKAGVAPVTGADITEAAARGDELCTRAFERVGTRLGLAMATVAAVVDPQRFIIGGGLSDAGPLLLEPARAALERSVLRLPGRPVPDVVQARLGGQAGMLGAGLMAVG